MVDTGLSETGLWIQYIFTLEFKINCSVIRGALLKETGAVEEGSHPGKHAQPLRARGCRGRNQRSQSKPQKQSYFFHRLRRFTFF